MIFGEIVTFLYQLLSLCAIGGGDIGVVPRNRFSWTQGRPPAQPSTIVVPLSVIVKSSKSLNHFVACELLHCLSLCLHIFHQGFLW